jgi:cytoskeletal protein CcmA (bactofilin family)
MLQAKPSLKEDLTAKTAGKTGALPISQPRPAGPNQASPAVPKQIPSPDLIRASKATAAARKEKSFANFQTRVPVIIGEANYTGMLPVDGMLFGQLGANGGTLSVRQKSRSNFFQSGPELNGELIFKDMLRVNGHIAGQVSSPKGTLIVDSTARVDANVDVAVAVIGGTVNGDIVAHQRVELGPEARINGNIWTQSIAIQPGAIFEGVCRMLTNEEPQK